MVAAGALESLVEALGAAAFEGGEDEAGTGSLGSGHAFRREAA